MKILTAHAEETERPGRPAAQSLEAVRQAGDFALRTPVEFGGTWAGPETVARRLAELARACPSTAWNVGTSAVSKTLAVMGLGAALPTAFTVDPHAQACGSGLPLGRVERGPEGAQVTGAWPNVSGCEDATWAGLGVMDGGNFRMTLIPTADLRVERTWDRAGMGEPGATAWWPRASWSRRN